MIRNRRWHSGLVTGVVIVASSSISIALDQDYPDIPGYAPGTPPWIPLIDACMTAGGGRIDCIEALPPDMYEAFLADEQARASERRALMRLPGTPPRVPPPGDLPHIYQSPLAVDDLSPDIARELAASGCLVPRSSGGESNVATGQLAAAGQLDVAVICSIDGVSEIRIFWGGDAHCPPLDETSPDGALLYEADEWEYFWGIAIAAPEHIRN